jgi:flavin-dependent dehydrogenase
MRPVTIAGAGLAGLVAANVLARAGRAVDVYERKSRLLPSSGPHTEGVRNYRSTDVLEELRSYGFDIAPTSTIHRTIRHSPHFRNVLHGPAHYLFMRGREPETVDQALYRNAVAAGGRFHFGEATDPGAADIAACGPPPEAFNILGAGYTFSSEGSPLDLGTAHALFDDDVAPGGYLVVTPGVPFHSIYSVSWKELNFERLLARTEKAFDLPWIREILGTSRWVGKIHGRAYFQQDPIAQSRRSGTRYVGEAGGFQDAVAGFGFRYAVVTGSLAARSVLEGQDYAELLNQAFGREFLDAYAFREKLNRASNDDYDRMVASMGPEITLDEYVKRREARGF